jgi:hypothetical protein
VPKADKERVAAEAGPVSKDVKYPGFEYLGNLVQHFMSNISYLRRSRLRPKLAFSASSGRYYMKKFRKFARIAGNL